MFLNKEGGVLDASQWAKDYWARALKALGVRYRRFYCARHTFITQAVKRGWLLKSLADYCGNSVSMIETNYCAVLTSNDLTVFEPLVSNYQNNLASPTGFEPKSCKRALVRSSGNRLVFLRIRKMRCTDGIPKHPRETPFNPPKTKISLLKGQGRNGLQTENFPGAVRRRTRSVSYRFAV